jgi:hypothetical protein
MFVRTSRALAGALVTLAICGRAGADPLDIHKILTCQKQIANQGARFAKTTIKNALRCTNEMVECQLNCDEGVYGPSCIDNPPPCCDSDDPGSNPAFGECVTEAEERCTTLEAKTASAELTKHDRISAACDDLTNEELCGSQTEGLNFATMAAGCAALIPGWQCDLDGVLNCVGGPLQQRLAEQIAGVLDPRAEDALSLTSAPVVTAIPRTRKVKETLAAGKVDVWSIAGIAGDEISVRIKTLDDGAGLSNLDPVLTYLAQDATTPVGDTNVVTTTCNADSCGAQCPAFKREFPFSGTFYLRIASRTSNGCGAGGHRLVVTTPGGTTPLLVQDDVDP